MATSPSTVRPHFGTPSGTARVANWLIVLGTAGIVYATLLPSATNVATEPFCLICGPLGGVDSVLNLTLFAPLGLGLALKRTRPLVAVAMMLFLTLAIEALQWQWIAGRDASLSDIVTNSVGGSIAFAAGRLWHSVLFPTSVAAWRLMTASFVAWLLLQLVVAYALAPTFPPPPYFGQIDRPASRARAAFPGSVLRAGVGDVELTAGALPNADTVRALLDSPAGTVAFADVTAGATPTSRRAEIVVISGPRMEGVLSLEQLGDALLFGVRTGAEVLRLRPMEYRLSGVFTPGHAGATLRVSGQGGRGRVRVAAAGPGVASRDKTFVPSLSDGWRLFSPVALYVEDDAPSVASGIYLLLLLLPSGYWAFFASRGAPGGRSRPGRVAFAAAAAIVTGLIGVPLALGLGASGLFEAVSSIGGLFAGWLCAFALQRRRTA